MGEKDKQAGMFFDRNHLICLTSKNGKNPKWYGHIFYLGEGKLQFGFSFSWLVALAATGVVVLSGSLSISLLAIEKAGQD
ncbi:MAG: hypothetical protein BECKG1743D_GA0114223_102231, partial [Candidatus Kentron sp. G]